MDNDSALRDQRIDPRSSTCIHVRLVEISSIRQQSLGLAEFAWQHSKSLQHRLHLLLVVGCLLHIAGDHQKAARGHRRLRVAALLEPAAGATRQGLKPDYTIADAGQDLRAGQKAAWDDTPCHGDVFHIQRQYEGLANTLSRLAKGARSRRQKLEARIDRTGPHGRDDELVTKLNVALQIEAEASWLARDIRTLTQWLSHDVLALAGPAVATRQMLYDFIVEELARSEPGDAQPIRPVRVALQNQRDDLLAFAGVLDDKLAAIARTHEISEPSIRANMRTRCSAGGAEIAQFGGHGDGDVEIRHRQHLRLPVLEPFLDLRSVTLGTTAVAARNGKFPLRALWANSVMGSQRMALH